MVLPRARSRIERSGDRGPQDRHACRAGHELRRLSHHGQEGPGKVPGVAKTDVNFDKREATVTFDDARTDVQALLRTAQDAGYSSTVVGSAK